MTQTDLIFELDLGLALKEMGLERASEARSDALALGRAYCKKAALSRPERLSDADDAALGFQLAGLPPDLLGPAAGNLFRTGDWEPTDRFVPSARVSRRGGLNRVWRLISNSNGQ